MVRQCLTVSIWTVSEYASVCLSVCLMLVEEGCGLRAAGSVPIALASMCNCFRGTWARRVGSTPLWLVPLVLLGFGVMLPRWVPVRMMGQRVSAMVVLLSCCLVVCWFVGLLVCWFVGLLVCCFVVL